MDNIKQATVHQLMQTVLELNLLEWAENVEIEKTLQNKKIADVYYEHDGKRYIIEVKSDYKASYIHEAALKYMFMCDFLFVAVPAGRVPKNAHRGRMYWGEPIDDRVGLLEIGNFGIAVVKTPEPIRGQNAPIH